MSRAAFLLMTLALSGCLRAKFIDERPDIPDLLPRADLVSTSDLSGDTSDLAGILSDVAGADFTTLAGPVATGTFEGRHGYNGVGSAELVNLGNGQYELRFGSDFSVSPVPGPVVYLSSRGALGNTIDTRTDLFLGELNSDSGAQSYLIDGDPGNRRYAWVYCGPFRVEVARALMTP